MNNSLDRHKDVEPKKSDENLKSAAVVVEVPMVHGVMDEVMTS